MVMADPEIFIRGCPTLTTFFFSFIYFDELILTKCANSFVH